MSNVQSQQQRQQRKFNDVAMVSLILSLNKYISHLAIGFLLHLVLPLLYIYGIQH